MQIQSLAEAGGAGGVVRVGVSEEQVPHSASVKSVTLDKSDDAISIASATGINERALATPIKEVDVAINGIGEREAVPATTHQVNAIRDLHENERVGSTILSHGENADVYGASSRDRSWHAAGGVTTARLTLTAAGPPRRWRG